MAVAVVADQVADPIDPLTAWLDDVLVGLADGVADCWRDGSGMPDAVRIALLEKIKSAAAALQVAESVRFAQSQAEAQLAANVHPDKIGRGIADQLGLACKISGFAAADGSGWRGRCGSSCPKLTG